MLTVAIGATSSFDDDTQKFVEAGGVTVELEHSLASLSKWEGIHEKPFLGGTTRTPEELLSYIECMLDPKFPAEEILDKLTEKNLLDIHAYIDRKMTATWFYEAPGAPKSNDVITAELIYYWMTVFHIPFECQYWHLNRLFTLIRVCNVKQEKPKKMGRAERVAQQREMNKRRREASGSKG